MPRLKPSSSVFSTRFESFCATAPYPRPYRFHTTTSSQQRRVSVVFVWTLFVTSSSASQRQPLSCTCLHHDSTFSTVPLLSSYAKTSTPQKKAASRPKSFGHVTATMTEKSVRNATRAYPSQPTLDYRMHGVFCSLRTSAQIGAARLRMPATLARAATRYLTTRTPSSTTSSRSRLAVTEAVCDFRVQSLTSMSLSLPSSSNASRTVLCASYLGLQAKRPQKAK